MDVLGQHANQYWALKGTDDLAPMTVAQYSEELRCIQIEISRQVRILDDRAQAAGQAKFSFNIRAISRANDRATKAVDSAESSQDLAQLYLNTYCASIIELAPLFNALIAREKLSLTPMESR